jgi:Pyridoxamine 5'-phosphate oxidase
MDSDGGRSDIPGAAVDAAELMTIVDTNAYMTLATADAEGTPWPSPVWFAHEGYTEFLWASRPNARHSQNIAVRPAVGIVIFDSTVVPGDGRAVYMEAAAEMVPPGELDDAVAIYSQASEAQGIAAWTIADVTGHAPHRLYRARAARHFVLDARDQRIPVQPPAGRDPPSG